MARKYRRGPDKTLVSRIVTVQDVTDGLVIKHGEMIALTGNKDRRYRAPVRLGPDKQPIRTPLERIRGGREGR